MVSKKTTKTKKTTVKKPVAKKVVEPVVNECPCGYGCTCGHKCGCHGGFVKKVILLLFVFALGCVSARYFYKPHHQMCRVHAQFDTNGCLVMDSIKCPKLQQALATADTDANGCISKMEYREVKKSLHSKTRK